MGRKKYLIKASWIMKKKNSWLPVKMMNGNL